MTFGESSQIMYCEVGGPSFITDLCVGVRHERSTTVASDRVFWSLLLGSFHSFCLHL